MTSELPYLEVPTTNQQIDFDIFLSLEKLESLVDLVELAMRTAFDSYLHYSGVSASDPLDELGSSTMDATSGQLLKSDKRTIP